MRRGAPPRHRQREDRGLAVTRAVVADADRGAVERQHVVVVVADGEAGVDGRGPPRGQVEAVQAPAVALRAAAAVVDQGLPVGSPVGRLEGLGRAQDDLAVAALEVEELQVAADVVAIGDEPVLGRTDDPDVAKDRPLRHCGVVGAEEESHVDGVAQRQVGKPGDRVWIAEARRGEDEAVPFPLELDDVGPANRRFDLLGDRAPRPSVLQGGEAIAVDHRVGVGRVGLEAAAHDPSRLAVRVHPRAHELDARLQDEVAGQLLPGEVELVPRPPHVDAGRGYPVLLGGRVVGCGARQPGRSDVAVGLEFPERPACGGRRADPRPGQHRYRSGRRRSQHGSGKSDGPDERHVDGDRDGARARVPVEYRWSDERIGQVRDRYRRGDLRQPDAGGAVRDPSRNPHRNCAGDASGQDGGREEDRPLGW